MKLLILISELIATVFAKNFIINGKRAFEGQFSSIVFIDALEAPSNGFTCGGTLISPTFVLTAAHCLVRQNTARVLRDPVHVYGGSIDINNFKLQVSAKRVIIHEKYSKLDPHHNHDIALIELQSPVTASDDVRIANLPESAPVPNALVDVVGWGLTENNATSDLLLYVTMSVFDANACRPYLQGLKHLYAVVCILQPTSQGVCSGDSGGPFYLKDTNTVVGVTSFGFGDESTFGCDPSYPNVGSSVYFYLNWINRNIAH